jgi:GGDEF domain-containing protein
MISIQQNLNDLEKSHRLQAISLDCYLAAINNVAHYAVDLDAAITAPHRKYLADLAGELIYASPEALVESRATLRGILRDYRDKAALYLSGLRAQLSATAQALQQMVDGLSQCDSDHGQNLTKDVVRLREIANQSDASVRAVLTTLADSIERNLEHIRKQQQFTISQLQTELRLLHSRIDSLEAAATTDDVSQLSTRRFMAEYLGAMPPEGACFLVLKIRGVAQARARFGQAVADDVVGTFGRRLRNTVPKDTVVGRWSEQDFLAIVPGGKANSTTLVKRVAEHLSMPYACMMKGKVVRVPLEVTANCLCLPANANPEQIQERVAEAFK